MATKQDEQRADPKVEQAAAPAVAEAPAEEQKTNEETEATTPPAKTASGFDITPATPGSGIVARDPKPRTGALARTRLSGPAEDEDVAELEDAEYGYAPSPGYKEIDTNTIHNQLSKTVPTVNTNVTTKADAVNAVDIPKVEQKMSYAQLYDYLNPEETEEEKQRKERRAYVRSGLAALGDGISALANIWGTANGAVNTSDGSGLSARASALLAKEREARETREEKRRAGLLSAKKADDDARAKAESDRLDREYKQKVLENTIENTKSLIEARTYDNRKKAEEAILKKHQAEYYVRKTAWVDAISASQIHKNNMAGKGGGSGTNKTIETQKYKAGWISEFSDLDLPMDYLKDTTNGSVEEKLSAAEIESLVKYVYDKGALPSWYTSRMIKSYANWQVPDVRRFKRGNSQTQSQPSGTKSSSSTQPAKGQLDTNVMGGFSIPPNYKKHK